MVNISLTLWLFLWCDQFCKHLTQDEVCFGFQQLTLTKIKKKKKSNVQAVISCHSNTDADSKTVSTAVHQMSPGRKHEVLRGGEWARPVHQ